jgi:hypothetical protein
LVGFLVGPEVVPAGQDQCGRPPSDARVEILSPANDEDLESGTVQLRVRLEGGEIASLASTTNRPGEGHIHISIDGRLESMSGESEQTLEVAPGNHEVEVEYVANDHASFCTRVVDRARFTVSNGNGGKA